MAEVRRSRTDRSARGGPTGFEVLGEHRPRMHFRDHLKIKVVLRQTKGDDADDGATSARVDYRFIS